MAKKIALMPASIDAPQKGLLADLLTAWPRDRDTGQRQEAMGLSPAGRRQGRRRGSLWTNLSRADHHRRDRCDQADLKHCSAHGLRKAGARRAAEAEGTQQGLKAGGGWKNDEEVSTYTAAVEQEGLAEITLARAIERFSDGGGS